MGCCEVIMKAILIITNVVVMVAGAVLLVAGGIFYSKQLDFFPDLKDYSANVNAVLVPMMIIGGILFLVGVIGCCGAVTGKSGLLNVYFAIVLIVVILEIVVIVLGVVKKDDFIETTEKTAADLFGQYKKYYVDGDKTDALDEKTAIAINAGQYTFECCGLTDGPAYWSKDGSTQVPPGCCSDWDGTNLPESGLKPCADEDTYKVGCTEQVKSLASEFETVIIIVIVAVIVFEIICLAAACYSKKNDMVA